MAPTATQQSSSSPASTSNTGILAGALETFIFVIVLSILFVILGPLALLLIPLAIILYASLHSETDRHSGIEKLKYPVSSKSDYSSDTPALSDYASRVNRSSEAELPTFSNKTRKEMLGPERNSNVGTSDEDDQDKSIE